MKHTYYHCGCGSNYCQFCAGGLGCCTVCHGFEGALTSECCGRIVTPEEEVQIYEHGTLDFKNGKWFNPQTTPCCNSPGISNVSNVKST